VRAESGTISAKSRLLAEGRAFEFLRERCGLDLVDEARGVGVVELRESGLLKIYVFRGIPSRLNLKSGDVWRRSFDKKPWGAIKRGFASSDSKIHDL
jgi:hypothetical protein